MKKSFLKWAALSIAALGATSGCASAWIVSQHPGGGVIGYRAISSEAANEAIKSKVPCDSYLILSDDQRSAQTTYTVNQAVTTYGNSNGTATDQYGNSYTYSGGGTRTTYVPVEKVNTTYWREATYRCN